MQKLLLVAGGGALGSVMRYLCILLMPAFSASSFPWAVFTVNSLGCLIAGSLTRLVVQGQMGTEASLLLITGFLGGFTTYSAFSIDVLNLYRNGQAFTAFIYAAGTVLVAVFSAFAGFWLCGIILRYLR